MFFSLFGVNFLFCNSINFLYSQNSEYPIYANRNTPQTAIMWLINCVPAKKYASVKSRA